MKNILTKLSFVGFIAMTMVLFSSCNKDAIREEPGSDVLVEGYTFLMPAVNAELVPSDNGVLRVTVSRTTADKAATVPVVLTASSSVANLFALESSNVTFEAGQYQADAIINYTIDDLAPATMYSFSVAFDDDDTPLSIGAVKKTTITATRKMTYMKSETPATMTSNDVYGQSFLVEFERCVESPGVYRILDMYNDGYDILIVTDPSAGTASIAPQEIGLSLFGADYPKTWIRADGCTFVNGVITVVPGGPAPMPYNRWLVDYPASTLGAWIGDTEIVVLPAGAY